MIIVKSPFRVSFFGGSTDYKSFYEKHGSLLIGTTIDKYAYLCMKKRTSILPQENLLIYSQLEKASDIHEIKQPLIRNVLEFYNVENFIEFTSFSDIPYRTGLGGSSSYCVGMGYLINQLNNLGLTRREIAQNAILIERGLMNEAGGIQDQIWATYGGLSSIKIEHSGDFRVKPLPSTEDFKKLFHDSLVLIYTNHQREEDEVARAHENKDKKPILEMAHVAYQYFIDENIKKFGELMLESWYQKRNLSPLISSSSIDEIIKDVISKGAYGAKLLGSGGCGFVLAICDPSSKKKIKEAYAPVIMEFNLEENGVTELYKK